MTDNQLIQLFFPIITAGLTSLGYTGVTTIAANQPTQQGIPTGPSVYFYKIGDRRYGFLERTDVWNGLTSEMIHTERQQYETTFQISTLVIQSPATPNQYTASDLANDVASIMQSDNTRNILYNSSVGILRVTDVSNGYFVDDKDNFEASPNFDFVLTHYREYVTQGNECKEIEVDIFRV
jgi:hypothetical protein